MKSLILLVFLNLFTHQSRAQATPGRCLTDADANRIAESWMDLWRGQLDKVGDVVASNFVHYDIDVTLKNTPAARGVTAMRNFIFDIALDSRKRDVRITSEPLLWTVHSCDRIVLQFEEKAVTTGLHKKETGIGPGKQVSFKGIDVLDIDLRTRKVKRSETTKNSLHYWDQVGYSVQPKRQR